MNISFNIYDDNVSTGRNNDDREDSNISSNNDDD